MEEQKRQSLDDFLNEQGTEKLYATIEVDKSDPTMVLVKPWMRDAGCSCHLALKIDRSVIEFVTPTDKTHYCCGKELKVVQIHFKPDQTLSLEEVFRQLSSSTPSHVHHAPELHSQSHFAPELHSQSHFATEMPLTPSRSGIINSDPHPMFPWDWYRAYKIAQCQNQLRNCQADCAFDDDPTYCDCACRNQYRFCTGIGRPVQCAFRQ